MAGSEGGDERCPCCAFPRPDTSPFLQVASDRKSAMERVAALCHLAHGLPWQFLVAPVGALLRKVAPAQALRGALASASSVADIVDRDELVELLGECGYLRVPVVEDPGSFAVRGALIDVYPPHAEAPRAHRARRRAGELDQALRPGHAAHAGRASTTCSCTRRARR